MDTGNGFLKQEGQEDARMYRLSSWWVDNREKVKGVGYMLFVALDAALLCFAIWTFADSFLISYPQERLAVAEMAAYGQADLSARSHADAAQPLQTGDALVLSSDAKTSDVYAPLSNPNADWWAEFSYAFEGDGNSTKPQRGFILPGQTEKPLLALGVTELGSARSAAVAITDVTWHRVDRHVTGDPEMWLKARLSFDFKNAAFVTNVPFGGKTIGQANFTVVNKSAFSYYNPTFVVLLKRGASIVGVSRTAIDTLEAGASRDVSISWFGALPAVGEIQVVPEINVFDLKAYKALTGESSVDTRERVF